MTAMTDKQPTNQTSLVVARATFLGIVGTTPLVGRDASSSLPVASRPRSRADQSLDKTSWATVISIVFVCASENPPTSTSKVALPFWT